MPAIGDVLAGRYRVDARLGAGGMATVWQARDLRLDRDVAVKVLLPNLAADPSMAARFDREARTLAAVADPRVVAVFDVVDGDPATGREPFLVMELCHEGSLGARLDARGTLPEEELLPLLADAADGVAALHRLGIVHRDVTPRNVLLAGGRAKLADLGLARGDRPGSMTTGPGGEHTTFTPAGVTIGTLAYLAPEVVAGASAGPSADVYGLGAIAFRALAGVPPRSAGPAGVARRAPLDLRELQPGVSPALAALVMESLGRDPSARPGAAALAARLREIAAVGSTGAASLPAPTPPGATEIGPTRVAPAAAAPSSSASTGRWAPAHPGAAARQPVVPRPEDEPRPSTARSAATTHGILPIAPPARPRTPPPGSSYHGPGLWSGELVLVLLVALVVFAAVVLVLGR